jgi:hypothetical protein
MRHQAMALCGVAIDASNWRFARRVWRDTKLGLLIVRGRELDGEKFLAFARSDDWPTIEAAAAGIS